MQIQPMNLGSPSLPANSLASIEALQELLEEVSQALSEGNPERLLEVSRQLQATANQLVPWFSGPASNPELLESRDNLRKKLLLNLKQQAHCRALLRRWRRRLVLQRHLLDSSGSSGLCSESLDVRWY